MDENVSGWQLKLLYLRVQSQVYFFGIFLIHINDLSDTLDSNVKPIADDTSMFLVANEPDTTSVKLNKDFDHVRL